KVFGGGGSDGGEVGIGDGVCFQRLLQARDLGRNAVVGILGDSGGCAEDCERSDEDREVRKRQTHRNCRLRRILKPYVSRDQRKWDCPCLKSAKFEADVSSFAFAASSEGPGRQGRECRVG